MSSDELLRKDQSKPGAKGEDGVLPGSSCYKHRAEMEMKKEQAAKLHQNNRQVHFGKSYKVCQPKLLNQQYLGQRSKNPVNPVNSNFQQPGTNESNENKLLSAM